MVFHQPHNSISHNFNANIYETEVWKQHFHKSFELVYVIKGNLLCYLNGEEYLLNGGDFGICLPNDIHAYEPEKNTRYWVCVFSEDYVHDFYKLIKDKTGGFVFRCNPSVTRFITENLINTPQPSRLLIKSALYSACDEYIKFNTLTDKNKKITENIAVITEYVEKNHAKDIKLSDIGRLLGYDYHYVSRYFHTVFKMSFSEFLTLYRLETATALLEQSDKKIVDIAMESGFQSIRSFNECFKSHFKTTPSEYRKNIQLKI